MRRRPRDPQDVEQRHTTSNVDDVGAGDLVVPALVVFVDRDPDESQIEAQVAQPDAEHSQERASPADAIDLTIPADDAQAEQSFPGVPPIIAQNET
jgi:hypothetical protein